MSRLFDRLIVSKHLIPEHREALMPATVIEASNVGKYFFQAVSKEIWDVRDDFPVLSPPFRNFFIEMRAPKFINSSEFGVKPWPAYRPSSWGLHFAGIDLRDGNVERTMRTLEQLGGRGVRKLFNCVKGTGVRWFLQHTLFLEWGKYNVGPPLCTITLALDEVGQVITLPESAGFGKEKVFECIFVPPHFMAHKQVEKHGMKWLEMASWEMRALCLPVYLAISFMHCKNVTLESVTVDEKVSRNFEKKHGAPMVSYHVLRIEPMQRELRRACGVENVGLERALHICRGHFKDYRQSGLFGKVAGVFWWDVHVRGTARRGVKLKDYEVVPSKEIDH